MRHTKGADKMKRYLNLLINKASRALGIEAALQSPAVQNKKLMRGNALLYNKRIFALICAGITFAVLTGVNLLGQLLLNIGGIVQGRVSPAQLFLPSIKLLPFYVFALFLSVGLCIYLQFKILINFRELNVGQKGHAAFMERHEIAERFPLIPEKNESFPGYGGVPVAREEKHIYIDNTVVNCIFYAATRGGKTEGFVVPTIDIVSRAEQKASMVIPDAKGTLTNTCVPQLLERGYAVYIINMFDFKITNYYNPLHVINQAYLKGDIDLAEELTTSLAAIFIEETGAKDRFWVDGPRALFAAIILALIEDCSRQGCPEKVNLYSTFLLLASLGKKMTKGKKESAMDSFFLNRPLSNPARLAYTTIDFAEGKTRSSLLSITISQLDSYRRSSVAKLTAKNDLNLTDIAFGEKPVAIFLRAPFYTQSYDALVSAFISQAFYMNMRKAALENNGKCVRRVRVVGDEFFNFPAIPGLDNMVTVCLGTGWSFDFYCQSPVQVEKKYGKEMAKIILENCASIYFLASPDAEARKVISELCGNITIENVTRSGERFSLSKSITEQYEERPLIPAQELSTFRPGEVICFPTMHRRNLAGEKVVPLPIFSEGEYSFPFRYEYLTEFNPEESIPFDKIDTIHGTIDTIRLEDIVYTPHSGAYVGNSSNDDESILMRDAFSPTQISFVRGLFPTDFDIDVGKMPVHSLLSLIQQLHTEGSITDLAFAQLRKLLDTLSKNEED